MNHNHIMIWLLYKWITMTDEQVIIEKLFDSVISNFRKLDINSKKYAIMITIHQRIVRTVVLRPELPRRDLLRQAQIGIFLCNIEEECPLLFLQSNCISGISTWALPNMLYQNVPDKWWNKTWETQGTVLYSIELPKLLQADKDWIMWWFDTSWPIWLMTLFHITATSFSIRSLSSFAFSIAISSLVFSFWVSSGVSETCCFGPSGFAEPAASCLTLGFLLFFSHVWVCWERVLESHLHDFGHQSPLAHSHP